jgi:hypothetical protein
MKVLRVLLAVAVVALVSSSAVAMFRASDLVIIPVAASTTGLNSSDWHTDLEIRNVDVDNIDVEISFLPTGGSNNKDWYQAIANSLGGRASDGFGHVDTKLMEIKPGFAVTLPDVVNTTWGANQKGALLIWAYKAGTLLTTTPAGGTPRQITASSRTYTLSKNADNKSLTYGQDVPGLPWYYYVDPYKATQKLNYVVFTGIEEDASFRSSFGVVNVSDPLTSITVRITLTKEDGTEVGSEDQVFDPLAHVQYDQFLYGLFTQATTVTIANATLTIKAVEWSSTGSNPTPGFMAYVTRIDNLTNAPTYREQAFEPELPWNCIFNGLQCPTPVPTATPSSVIGLGVRSTAPRHLRPPVPGLSTAKLW